MKDLFDAIPDEVAPEAGLEGDADAVAVTPPDDDDVIRPAYEEELGPAHARGALTSLRGPVLAKHLLWTFGPHHRDFPFMLQLRVEVDGDRLITVDPEIGWLHQGLEKMLEHVTLEDAFRLLERLRPEGSLGHKLAWCFAVEKAFGVEHDVPAPAQLWRVVVAELSRIQEHLRVLRSQVLAHGDARVQAQFLASSRTVATLVELAGFRDGTCVVERIGGIVREVDDGVIGSLERGLPDALVPLQAEGDRLWRNPAFVDALSGRGPLLRSDAVDLGLSGPALRACGADDDVRVRNPYFAYEKIAPRVAVQASGDALARFAVRLDEVAASSAMVLRALAAYAGARQAGEPLGLDDDRLIRDDDGALCPPEGRAAVSVELPSGELSVLLATTGGPRPGRVRVRGPSFPLAFALSHILVGARLDDVVPILHGLGMSGTELDR